MLKDRFGREYRNKKVEKKRDVLKKKKLDAEIILEKLNQIVEESESLKEIKDYESLGRVFLAIEEISANLERLKKELFVEIYETEVYTIVERVYVTRAGIGGS